MKKSVLIFATAFLAVTFFLTGCKKSDSTTNPTDNNNTNTGTDQPIPSFGTDVAGVLASIQFSYTIPNMPAPYSTVAMDMGFATFGNNGVDAGNVTLNGKAIAKSTSGASVYYNSFASTDPTNPPASLSLNWNGSAHSWKVSGSANVPAFTLNVTSPSSFSVNSPAASATVTKSSGLTVTWSGASSSATDSVMILLVSTSNTASFEATTTNKTGSYTISASQLSAFSGDAMLEVVKYKYATTSVNSKTYVGVAEIVNTVNFKLQ